MSEKVAVVTGGASGIGGAISRRLAREGFTVVVNDIDEDAAEIAATEIRALGADCHLVIGDVTEPATVESLRALVVDELGGVTALVNNVGDFRPASKCFTDSKPEQWERLYQLNLQNVFTVTHALLPSMIDGGRGAIVNNATVEAFRGIPGHAVYSAYNAGVVAFTRSLAVEVGRHGVRVNAIAPDLIDTPQTSSAAMLRGRDPELITTWLPLGRYGVPDDCASAASFLISDDARFVTGHTIPVDGGTLAASGWYTRADGKGWTKMPDRP